MNMSTEPSSALKATITLKEALTAVGVVGALLLTLVGVIYNDGIRRITKLEDKVDKVTDAIVELKSEVETRGLSLR